MIRPRRLRSILSAACLAVSLSFPFPAPAQSGGAAGTPYGGTLARGERFAIHRVQSGNTLERIALNYLGSADHAWIVARYNGVREAVAGTLVAIPLGNVDFDQIRQDGLRTVPVLSYHRFDGKDPKMSVSPEQFRRQMELLKTEGYRSLTGAQLLDYLNGRRPVPPKSVLITIDDGFRSTYSVAFPVLKRLGFTAVLFLYPKYIGSGRTAMTWAQVREMAGAGFDIGSHTMTHVSLLARENESATAYEKRLAYELEESRRVLEEKAGVPVNLFAYPYGHYDGIVASAVAHAGYEAAFTVIRGGNASTQWPYALKRSMIYGDAGLDGFRKNIATWRKLEIPWKLFVRTKE